MEIKVFSTPTCPWCDRAKEFLKEKKVAFESIDVTTDEKGREEMLEKTGQMGVPVVQIGETWIVGFNADAMSKALE